MIHINDKGKLVGLTDPSTGNRYESAAYMIPLIRVIVGGQMEMPVQTNYVEESGVMTLEFTECGAAVDVLVEGKGLYVTPIDGDDARIVGTRIALFGCEAERVLETIEAIELGEGLPHPIIEGVWGKTSPGATQSYLITCLKWRTNPGRCRSEWRSSYDGAYYTLVA
ncbi:hypothetical protein [Paenibacillus germinis]|uniref:hypothetical protein n=1 Tax=Paenibacillus germinis TaxID=2654979 RepID=UPI001491E374|nr:hypothetical protein [Paenibacillus germinis]